MTAKAMEKGKNKKKPKTSAPTCKTLELVPMGECVMPRRYNPASTSYYIKAPYDFEMPARCARSFKLNFGLKLPKGMTAVIVGTNENMHGIHGIGNTVTTKRRWLLFKSRQRVVTPRTYNAYVQTGIYDSTDGGTSMEINVLNLDEGFTILKGSIIARLVLFGTHTPFIFKHQAVKTENIPLIGNTPRGRTPKSNDNAATDEQPQKDNDNVTDGRAGDLPEEN